MELFYMVGGNVFLVLSIIFLLSPRLRRQINFIEVSYWGDTTIGRGIVRKMPSDTLFMCSGALMYDMSYFFGNKPTDPATKISEYLALIGVAFFVFVASTALVNRPKFMVLKKHRDEPGMIQEYLTRWANRRNHPPKHPTRTTRHGQPPEPAEPEPSPTEPPPQPTHHPSQPTTAPRPPHPWHPDRQPREPVNHCAPASSPSDAPADGKTASAPTPSSSTAKKSVESAPGQPSPSPSPQAHTPSS